MICALHAEWGKEDLLVLEHTTVHFVQDGMTASGTCKNKTRCVVRLSVGNFRSTPRRALHVRVFRRFCCCSPWRWLGRIRRIGHYHQGHLKKSLNSVVKVPESVRQSPAPWESEPKDPPRKKAKTSFCSRRDDSREQSRDRRDRNWHRNHPRSSDQDVRQWSPAGASSSRNRSTAESGRWTHSYEHHLQFQLGPISHGIKPPQKEVQVALVLPRTGLPGRGLIGLQLSPTTEQNQGPAGLLPSWDRIAPDKSAAEAVSLWYWSTMDMVRIQLVSPC